MSDLDIEFVDESDVSDEESDKSQDTPKPKPKPIPKSRKPKKSTDAFSAKDMTTIPVKKRIARVKAEDKPATVKKGPGRPRLNPSNPSAPRSGISKKPNDPDNHIELVYDQPIIMKKIFQFFKAIAASQIQIIFRPKDIIFYANDHHGKSKIRIRIDAEKLNSYYCKSVIDIGIDTKPMELVLNKVDKEYKNMLIYSDNNSLNKHLVIVLENNMDIYEMHNINLISIYNKMEDEAMFNDSDYTIRFNFPSKYFKKTISDIKSISNLLSIAQEDADSPIVFEYCTANNRMKSKHTLKNKEKIGLVSNLKNGDSFRVDISIEYIKPISSAQIADDVMILLDENRDFMTLTHIDNGTIEIKTLTEIVDERPEDD
jgi:hypothetical protein